MRELEFYLQCLVIKIFDKGDIMFHVVIADDESRIIKTIMSSIAWTKLGLSVVGIASDGLQALDLAEREKADILITDIRMPVLDGLELCERLHKISPKTQIILISGYADFSYAQKGIELGVLGYCLKPLNISELQRLLIKAVKSIQKESILRADTLLDYIENGENEDPAQMLRQFGFTSSLLYVAVSVRLPNCTQILGAGLTIKLGRQKYLYLSETTFNQDLANELIKASDKGGISLSQLPVSASSLKSKISESEIMAYQFFITGGSFITESPISATMSDEFFTRLQEAFTSSNKLLEFIKGLRKEKYSYFLDISSAYRLYNRIISYLSSESGKIGKEEYYLNGYEQLVDKYSNMENLFDELEKWLLTTTNQVAEIPKFTTGSSSFMNIIKYLNENYEKDISLTKLAEVFHLNASYISYLIKSETGLTYSQYLTELRIGKAKELLKTTNLSLTEISEAVGFNDYFYFIKKFKKVVGVTPGHYT